MNRQKFLKSLPGLTGWRESAFMLSLAERALPNALLYLAQGEQQVVDISVYPRGLLDLMNASWDQLIRDPNEENMIELLDDVLACLPDFENDDSYGALPTGDCLWLWEQALVSGFNHDRKRALEASQRSIESITQFIEFSEGEGLSENQLIKRFDSHDLVKREFSFQQELSDSLRSADKPKETLIEELRSLAQDEGVSNIGIALD